MELLQSLFNIHPESGLQVSDFIVHMFVRDVNRSWTWVFDLLLGPCRPDMRFSQPKKYKKMETIAILGRLLASRLLKQNLSMKSKK